MRFGNQLHHDLLHNIVALYGVQIANYIFPLIIIPYLARVLGPIGWGTVAMAQAFGQYIALMVEYGFSLSATREVARARNSLNRREELLAGIMGAKVLLAFLAVGIAWVASRWVGAFRADPAVLWAGVFWALALAFSPMWYFQGMERMRFVAALDVIAKTVSLVSILLLVQTPGDAWKVPTLMGLASLVSTFIGLVTAYREVPFRFPSIRGIANVLQIGWSMFLFRSAVSLYTVGNTFILGLFAPPQIVGYYAGAEKISKAFVGLLGPVSQALYPRLSHLVQESRAEAARIARVGVQIMGLGGLLMGIIVFILAPLLVRLLLGLGYEPVVSVLRMLALLPPLIALSNVLGIQWMLPLGLDRPFNVIIISAGLLNLVLAVILAPFFTHMGMALAVVISETFVTASVYLFLRRRAQNLLALSRAGQISLHERESSL